MPIAPDLAGLSLGGAYQAALAAGFEDFTITAYRQSPMADPTFLWLEVAPAMGYVVQTTSAGSGGTPTANTPPEGSFYTTHPEPGVPDQLPEPGDNVSAVTPIQFVYAVPDSHSTPNDYGSFGRDASGLVAWWEYEFSAGSVPTSLQADLSQYNGLPKPPVDVDNVVLPLVAVDPLAIFSSPPLPDPADLILDVPEFERPSYEIQTVLRVVGMEIARIDAARLALIANFFPISADLLLPRFEQLLGLPVSPLDSTGAPIDLALRRARVLAYLGRLRGEGRGLDWIDAISALCGTNWNYLEHDPANPNTPAAYTLNVNISMQLARVGWNLVRDVTPAHIDINPGYVEGWFVGIAELDITLL